MARARGGGPSLAGDALLSLSPEDAQIVLQQALTQQSRLRESEVADVVVNTHGETSEAVTHLIRTSLETRASLRAEQESPGEP